MDNVEKFEQAVRMLTPALTAAFLHLNCHNGTASVLFEDCLYIGVAADTDFNGSFL